MNIIAVVDNRQVMIVRDNPSKLKCRSGVCAKVGIISGLSRKPLNLRFNIFNVLTKIYNIAANINLIESFSVQNAMCNTNT
ncbi:MAG: hypothetical protein ACTHKP_09955, partial [Nitrososphaeraceae archaeon]